MKFTKRNFKRALSIICALALLLSAMPLILATTVSATTESNVFEFTTNLVDNMPENYGCQAPDAAEAFADVHVGSPNLQRYVHKAEGGEVDGLAVTSPNNSTINVGNMPSVRMFGIIVPTNVESDILHYNTRRALVADIERKIEIKVTYDVLNVNPEKTVFVGITTGRGSYGSGSGWCQAVSKFEAGGSSEYKDQVLEGTIEGNLHAADVLGTVTDSDRVGFGFSANTDAVLVIKEVKVKVTYTPYDNSPVYSFSTNLVDNMPEANTVPESAAAFNTNFGSANLKRYDHGDGLAVNTANGNVNNIIKGSFNGVRSFGLIVPTTVRSMILKCNTYRALLADEGLQIKVKVTYDILNLNGNTASVAISTTKENNYTTGNSYGYAFKKYAAATEYKDEVLEGVIEGPVPGSGAYDLIGFSYACTSGTADLVIKNVEVTVTKLAPVMLNDNGVITGFTGNTGDTLPAGTNAPKGEKFMGWYDNPNFEGSPVTKAPEKATLYARYPSTVIDFNNFINPANIANNLNGKGQLAISDGIFTFTNNSAGGFEIPAYDANLKAQYHFTVGNQYNVTLVLTDAYESNNKTSSIATTVGSYSTSREVDYQMYFTEINKGTEGGHSGPVTSTVKVNYQSKKDPINTNLIIRSTSDSQIQTLLIDKIIITQLTGGTENYFYNPEEGDVAIGITEESTSVRGESGSGDTYQSAGIRFRGHVSSDTKTAADEIGFYVIPTWFLEEQQGEDSVDFAQYLKDGGSQAAQGICYQKGVKDVIYEEGGDGSCDYQVILVGLTVEGLQENLLDTEFMVVMYYKVGDEITFSETKTDSFDAAYNRIPN